MKQTFLSDINIKNKFLLKLKLQKEGITKNDRRVCRLLFSVIILAGTLTCVAGPLRNSGQKLAEESRYMQKEIELYREFARDVGRQEKQLQQQIRWQLLQAKMPEQIDPERFVRLLYRKAEKDRVRIHKIKQVPGKAPKGKPGKPNFLAWEMVCSGNWNGLTAFVKEVEKQEPLTRLNRAVIIKSRQAGEISLQANVHVYFSL